MPSNPSSFAASADFSWGIVILIGKGILLRNFSRLIQLDAELLQGERYDVSWSRLVFIRASNGNYNYLFPASPASVPSLSRDAGNNFIQIVGRQKYLEDWLLQPLTLAELHMKSEGHDMTVQVLAPFAESQQNSLADPFDPAVQSPFEATCSQTPFSPCRSTQ